MRTNHRILAVIPAYNEEASLPETLAELRQVRPDIDVVVVDDGSSDGTDKVAYDAGVHVIRLPVNLGIGGAVQTGMQYALASGYDIAFQYDADGQHRPEQIANLLQPIAEGEADMVLGSRFLEKTGYRVSLVRGALMWLLRAITSLASGQRITDSTSGFRAYGKRALALVVGSCSYDHPEIEVVIRLARSGYRVREVPVVIGTRRAGTSMFNAMRGIHFVSLSIVAALVAVLSTSRAESHVEPATEESR